MKVDLGSVSQLWSRGGVLLILPLALLIFAATTPKDLSASSIPVNILENGFTYQITTQPLRAAELIAGMNKEGLELLYPSPETILTPNLTVILQSDRVETKFKLTQTRSYQTPAETETPTFTGLATWYQIPTGLTAASREFKRGTKLLVTNLANGKSVTVRINDYGPKVYTGVSLDLGHEAFAQLASLSEGKIRVKYRVVS